MTTPIRLVVADLAGTTIDFGSSAPAGVFVDVFARHGVAITTAEARGPMGTAKRDHIATLAAAPRIAAAWLALHGQPFTEADLDRLYAEFIPLQLESLPRFADRQRPGSPHQQPPRSTRSEPLSGPTGSTPPESSFS